MAPKKKTKKKQTKKVARNKAKPVKKARKPKLSKKSAAGRQAAAGKTARATTKRVRGKSENVNTVAFAPEGLSARYGGQSGDLQGLSSRERADSESVDELLEEGNALKPKS